MTHSTGGSHARAAQAQERAFKEYVEPELEILLRVALTLTGSRADAEDLVQETLIRAYRGVERFDGRHARAWLLTILRNTNANMHRRRRPETVEDVSTLPGMRPAFGAHTPRSPEESVVDTMFEENLERAVQALDPRFRTTLLLIDVDRLTYTEAAEVLGVPVGTVMSRLSRARERVRHRLHGSHLAIGRSS